MSLGARIKSGLRAAVAPTLFLGLVGYFMWNATQGDRGLQAYAVRERQLQVLRTELDKVRGDQHDWNRRVSELQSQHLDPDMLDERARAMLNLVDPTEVVVPYGQGKRLFSPP